MTLHEVLHTFTGQVIMTVCLLLLTGQMAFVFTVFRDRRNLTVRLLYLLHFLITFGIFYLFLMDIDWGIDNLDAIRTPPGVLAAFRALPMSVMILYEALTALILLAALLELHHYQKNHPTFESIKETMDLLPVGIAFGRPDGTVVFRNIVMNDLSRVLTGKGITDSSAFREAAVKEAGSVAEDSIQFTLPGESLVWQLSEESMEVDGVPYTQMVATDITAQAAVTKELEEKNEKLRELHMRLDIYNKQADRIIIAQELLTARMVVHNEVGNVLLESRHYMQDPSSIDEELLLRALKNTNTYLLREYEEDDTGRDPLTDALEMADAIGVDVMITGMIPSEDPFRTILASAINECATNTIKHAGGDRLWVELRKTDGGITYILQNNGTPPEKTVRETGGLLSLRAIVEKERGTMQSEGGSCFRLTIFLPAGSR